MACAKSKARATRNAARSQSQLSGNRPDFGRLSELRTKPGQRCYCLEGSRSSPPRRSRRRIALGAGRRSAGRWAEDEADADAGGGFLGEAADALADADVAEGVEEDVAVGGGDGAAGEGAEQVGVVEAMALEV